MKLSRKLLVICLTLIIIPSLMLTAAWLLMRSYQTREIRRAFELEGKVDPYSFSAAQRFDVMMHSMVQEPRVAQEKRHRQLFSVAPQQELTFILTTGSAQLQWGPRTPSIVLLT